MVLSTIQVKREILKLSIYVNIYLMYDKTKKDEYF